MAEIFTSEGIVYEEQVGYKKWPEIKQALGKDRKKFDFVVNTSEKTFLIEVNFYSGEGSKLNEVARAYTELASKINSIPGFEFIWITDGKGWDEAKSKLQEAFESIPGVYNLTSISDFISRLK